MTQELSKEELLDKIERDAQKYEEKYYGCARCTLLALQENLNLGNDLTFQASTPLSAGIAWRGETCGALLGGLLAIGLVTASKKIESEPTFFDPMAEGFRFFRRFEKAMGSNLCRDIQKAKFGRSFNLADPKEFEEFENAGGHAADGCPQVVGKAARLAAEFIMELREKQAAKE